jgi:hypothetical protein
MVLRKRKIIINGEEIEVEIFDTKVKIGTGEEIESVEALLREDMIERDIKNALKKIKSIANRYKEKRKNIFYFYEVGKVLQFVDKKGYVSERKLIWERMADNLNPELFGGKKKNANESKRYPEFMYLLAKLPREMLKRASWEQWYEILKFRKIYADKTLLEQILRDCRNKNLTGPRLRSRIKELRKLKIG